MLVEPVKCNQAAFSCLIKKLEISGFPSTEANAVSFICLSIKYHLATAVGAMSAVGKRVLQSSLHGMMFHVRLAFDFLRSPALISDLKMYRGTQSYCCCFVTS